MRNTLPILSSLLLLGITGQGQNAPFYKDPPLFSTAPDPNKSVEIIARFGPVGMSLELHQPNFTMQVGTTSSSPTAPAVNGLERAPIFFF